MLVVANWKMNLRVAECSSYISSFSKILSAKSVGPSVRVVLCPPFTHLPALVAAIDGSGLTYLSCGSQNVHWLDSGAQTGEISASMLNELGVKYAIVGHSERRTNYGETSECVALRAAAASNAGLTPIVCVGERTREDGSEGLKLATQQVLTQLEISLNQFPPHRLTSLAVAYEPVWAIGTGKAATPEIIADMHGNIRNRLESMFGAPGSELPILYGGSTSPQNAGEIMDIANVGGVLVGNASLKPESFADIVLAA